MHNLRLNTKHIQHSSLQLALLLLVSCGLFSCQPTTKPWETYANTPLLTRELYHAGWRSANVEEKFVREAAMFAAKSLGNKQGEYTELEEAIQKVSMGSDIGFDMISKDGRRLRVFVYRNLEGQYRMIRQNYLLKDK